MLYEDWKPIYNEILGDFGYEKRSDDYSACLLRHLMANSNIVSEDRIAVQRKVTVFGGSGSLENDLRSVPPEGTLIAAGSAAGRLAECGLAPDIIVTDLDGDMEPQIEASRRGAIAFIHAHGDNAGQIWKYAREFVGPVVLTTQSEPDSAVFNYGGFTDGDRAVCIARHFGAKDILLLGFDFEKPSEKEGSDPQTKVKKLRWAEKIIFEYNEPGVSIMMPR
jgi:uncharacterized Rossmann fold enzyme